VQQGFDLVDETGSALDEILAAVSEIAVRINTIATSAQEQAQGIKEINGAVNDLDHVTQQNAAMFEETTAASHALNQEAAALVATVENFKLGELKTAKTLQQHAPVKVSATPEKSLDDANWTPQAAVALKSQPEQKVANGWEDF
jgi:methyl-accepting chemotaxis protein